MALVVAQYLDLTTGNQHHQSHLQSGQVVKSTSFTDTFLAVFLGVDSLHEAQVTDARACLPVSSLHRAHILAFRSIPMT